MLRSRARLASLASVALVAACSSAAAPSAPPSAATTLPPLATSTPVASAPAASATPAPSATPVPTGPATLQAPTEVGAGESFEVSWTGPAAAGDYVTIVEIGTERWTDESYFDTSVGSPGGLTAPTVAGDYELWYVTGSDGTIKTRRPIVVRPFVGTLDAPAEVSAGTDFEVSWTGPDGPGDYVTIVAEGATAWTTEDYFYTSTGSTGTLTAPIEPGPHEIWYVTGQETEPLVRRPITVAPFTITLDAPASVQRGASFEVTWTGPDGPSDYITIVPAGSPDGTYRSYAYTSTGSPVTITAPGEPGEYEIRYASDRVDGTFARRPITVR